MPHGTDAIRRHWLIAVGLWLAALAPAQTQARAQAAELDLETIAECGLVDPALAAKLCQRVGADFSNVPLADALAELSQRYSLPIHVDDSAERELQRASGVTARLSEVSLAGTLELLLPSRELTWLSRDGAVLVVSKDRGENALSRRIYAVGPLLQAVHDRRFTSAGVLALVTTLAAPTAWDEVGGPCSARLAGSRLSIDADRGTHAEVARALAELQRAYGLRKQPVRRELRAEVIRRLMRSTKVSIDAEGQPLNAVCQRVAGQAGLAVFFDLASLSDAGVTVNTPCTLHAVELTLATALHLLLGEFDLTWAVRNETLVVTSREAAENMLASRYFAVADLCAPRPGIAAGCEEELAEIITMSVAPSTWDGVGGPGALQPLPRVLLVSQTEEVLDDIENLLERMRAAKRGDAEAARGAVGWRAKIESALARPAALHVTDEPLDAVAETLRDRYAVPIVFDQKALTDSGLGADTPVSLAVDGVSLRSLLNLLLDPLDLSWTFRHESLLITTKIELENMMDIEIYDVAEVAPAMNDRSAPPDPLAEIITETIEPTTWDVVGGPGSIAVFGPWLIVAQSRPAQENIVQLLDDLRSLYGLRRQATSRNRETVRCRRALAALVGFAFRNRPLSDALDDLGRQAGISIVLDHRALTDEGIDSEVPLSARMTRARLRFALTEILRPLKLKWLVRNEVLYVTTDREAERLLTTKVMPANSTTTAASASLAETIRVAVAPKTWDKRGGPGFIAAVPRGLVVMQTREVLEQIECWLAAKRVAPQSAVRVEEP
ncbi:MAG TPA: hypothetical protein VMV10_23885 [Pirellulales bacterium]|nr:hypothetical protein [Pirellulales bacterium]